jgi:hypothetical protein
MPSDAIRSRTAHCTRATVPALIAALAGILLLRFPPATHGFYPQCPIHYYFHVLCPGCGTTRALAALLHGRPTEALRFNALTTLLTPVAIFYAAAYYRRIITSAPLDLPQPPRAAIYATLGMAMLFTLARNL